MATLAWLSFHMDRGLDITDESFYLLSAQWGDNTTYTNTRFGHYLDIMLLLASQEIWLVRIMGLFLLAAGCISLATSGTYYCEFIHSLPNSRLRTQITAAAAVAGGTIYYGWWLPTPSYNWFALTCCLFAFATTLSLCRILHRNSGETLFINSHQVWIRCVAISICLVICFFCKAPTGAALSILIFIALALNLRLLKLGSVLALIAFTSVFATVIHLQAFEGGLINYLNTVEVSLTQRALKNEEAESLNFISRFWDQFANIPIHVANSVPLALLASLLMLPLHLVRELKIFDPKIYSSIKCWILIGVIGLGAFELYGVGHFFASRFTAIGEALCALACLVIWTALIAPGKYNGQRFDFPRFQTLTIAVLVLMLAFIFAFGTSNPLLGQTSLAGVFYVSTILFIVADFEVDTNNNWGLVITSITFCALAPLVLSKTALPKPYRLPTGLTEQRISVEVPINGNYTLLNVDPATAKYINSLKTSAVKSGWLLSTPIIDLTGGTPAAALVLGGEPVGAPWLLGGYPGSESAAGFLLALEDRVLVKASWILTAPEGARSISPNILGNLGLRFPDEYVAVVTVTTGHRNERQILWKPMAVVASPK